MVTSTIFQTLTVVFYILLGFISLLVIAKEKLKYGVIVFMITLIPFGFFLIEADNSGKYGAFTKIVNVISDKGVEAIIPTIIFIIISYILAIAMSLGGNKKLSTVIISTSLMIMFIYLILGSNVSYVVDVAVFYMLLGFVSFYIIAKERVAYGMGVLLGTLLPLGFVMIGESGDKEFQILDNLIKAIDKDGLAILIPTIVFIIISYIVSILLSINGRKKGAVLVISSALMIATINLILGCSLSYIALGVIGFLVYSFFSTPAMSCGELIDSAIYHGDILPFNSK